MLNRQRIILDMLRKAGGTASRIQLMKWAFLLTRETSSGGGTAFYDFVPHTHGPHSFLLEQDIIKIVKKGIVRVIDEETWSLVARDGVPLPPDRELQGVASIMLRYGDWSAEDLISDVCSRYPWFTINCERLEDRLEKRPVARPAVYTIGYQGTSIDAFLNKLMQAGIKTLADVRDTPYSRTYGFHRGTLRSLCENVGIEYQGFPELGIPSHERADLKTREDREALFDRYRKRVSRQQTEHLASLARMMSASPTALVCMESDPALCHRSQLADLVSEINNLSVVHL